LTFIFSICLPFILSISITESIYRSLAFLIAASPCALIIATPTAYLSAINACAKKGIILKGGITLDALTKCSVVAFDKTGTLTTGDLQIVSIEANNPDLSLAIAAGLEMHVTHPIAKSICSLANEKSIKPIIFDTVKVESGLGIKAILDGKQVIIGLPEFVGVKVDRKNQTVAVLKFGDDISIFRFKDTIRLEIKNLLKTLSLRCIMLTGDHHRNAAAVAQEVGIEEVYADLRPEDKLEKVSHLSDKVGLAMVGDGINDAPALARATVGISMGKIGSGSAVDASDVILLNDNIHHLQWLFAKANTTSKIVKQNLTVALIVILFATLPSLMGKIPLWLAVLLHEGGTVLVGLNSLRLLKK
jgi:Cd2+/Zn2+-exporting ATPase